MFSAYLVYYHKFNLNVCAAQVSLDYSRKLVRIAIAMGGTIGLSFFIFASVELIYSRIFKHCFHLWWHSLAFAAGCDFCFLNVYKEDAYHVQIILFKRQSKLNAVLTLLNKHDYNYIL